MIRPRVPAALILIAASTVLDLEARRTQLLVCRHDGLTDYFYTIDPSQYGEATGLYQYTPDYSTPIFVEDTGATGANPLMRFWKGYPQYEHFYTTSAYESSLVQGWGWQYERNEGFLFSYPVQGSLPVHRFNRFNGGTGDLVHFFTFGDQWYVSILQASGWGYDGVAGYAFDLPSFNAGRLSMNLPPVIMWGETRTVQFTFQNSGEATWPANRVGLALDTVAASQMNWTVPFSPVPVNVAHFGTYTFNVTITAPPCPWGRGGCAGWGYSELPWFGVQMYDGIGFFGAANGARIQVGPDEAALYTPSGPPPNFAPIIYRSYHPDF